jgi:glycosyltransferase involved in cell wall biosynthesis
LRVAVSTETFPPEVNGVAMSIAQVIDGLHASGHHVDLVRPWQGPSDMARSGPGRDEFLVSGVPLPGYGRLRLGLPCTGRLVQRWQQQRPDVVHIATEGPLGWSALRAARRLKLPVTSDFRTNFHAYSAHYGVAWLAAPVFGLLRRLHNACDATMVPTAALKNELESRGFERVQVVGRGVDTELFHPRRRSAELRRHWGADPSDLVVACVGRLAAEKNLELVIQAFHALRQRHPRAKLLWVGDGPQRSSLQSRCPDAVFVGDRRGVSLAEHYASADLFLFPSLTETFGNVVPEAMASGLAVLAYNRAAAAQLIEAGHNGCLAGVGNEADFVERAVQLADDSALRRRLGLAAAQTAAALSWGDVVRHFERVLASCVEKSADGVAWPSQHPAQHPAQRWRKRASV